MPLNKETKLNQTHWLKNDIQNIISRLNDRWTSLIKKACNTSTVVDSLSKNGFPGYNTKLCQIVRQQLYSSMEYPFIAITPRSSLPRSRRTY